MGVKHNKIHILPTVFIITSYNLLCVYIMVVWISFVILVTMVTILAGKYGSPSYQHTYIYKMEKCHLLAIATVIMYISTEPSSHQHSETAGAFFNFVLCTEL